MKQKKTKHLEQAVAHLQKAIELIQTERARVELSKITENRNPTLKK